MSTTPYQSSFSKDKENDEFIKLFREYREVLAFNNSHAYLLIQSLMN